MRCTSVIAGTLLLALSSGAVRSQDQAATPPEKTVTVWAMAYTNGGN
jgi:hypothetical protein